MLLRHRQVCQQVPILKLNFRKCDYDGPVSFKNYKAVSSSTLARWLKNVLLLAGIDIVKYKAHSYRGASSSAASRAGCKMSEILKTANWSSAKNFKVFYLRDVQNDHIENNYQNCVLNSR